MTLKRSFRIKFTQKEILFLKKYFSDTNNNRLDFQKKINQLISKNIDAQKVMTSIFKCKKKDIFMSFSHKDIDLVLGLSKYIYDSIGLTCFIDSEQWGNIGDIRCKLIKTYARNKEGIIDEDESYNISTNLSTILRSRLDDEMSKCIYFLFVDTPNSIKENKNKLLFNTSSNWLFEENKMQKAIKKRAAKYSKTLRHSKKINFNYKIDLSDFVLIHLKDIDRVARINILENNPINVIDNLCYEHDQKNSFKYKK